MSPELDTFETKLLAELRPVFAEQDARARRTALRHWGPAAATAALLAAGYAGALALSPPAFAVEPQADHTVTVTINRPEDPRGLEAALAKAGVRAVITYHPEGKICRQNWTPSTNRNPLTVVSHDRTAQTFTFRVDGKALAPDVTLVLQAWWPADRSAAVVVRSDLATGPVGTCVPVDARSAAPTPKP